MTTPQDAHGASHGSLTTYITGFILSLGLTALGYILVAGNLIHGTPLLIAVAALAIIQLIVQLIFFLHFGSKSQSNWNYAVFALAVMVVTILVGGSIWIMTSLNVHMTPSEQIKYINSQDGL